MNSWIEFVVTNYAASKHFYRWQPSRITTSHNRFGLYKKHNRHEQVTKINSKRKPRAYKGLSRISVDHSRTCRVPAPFATPCPSRWGKAREGTRVCLFLPHLLHTFASALRTAHYLSMHHYTSTGNVGLKSCLPPCMNVPLRFNRNYLELHMGQAW
jgi:hypothetical protein